MAIGNLIYHTGTDLVGGAYDWPIPPIPNTVTVNARGWNSSDHGYFGTYQSGTSADRRWHPNAPYGTYPPWTAAATPISKDATETRYNLWWKRTGYSSSSMETGIVAVVEDGAEWNVFFIHDTGAISRTDSEIRTLIDNWKQGYPGVPHLESRRYGERWTSNGGTDGTWTSTLRWVSHSNVLMYWEVGSIIVTADGVAPAEDAPPVTQLVFTQQPSASTATDAAFTQQPVIEIRDLDNVLIDTATDEVTLALVPGTGSLAGTATVAAVAGVATFSGLAVDTPGADKILMASGAGAAPVDSAAFTITPVFQLVFTQQPSVSTASGVAFAQQPVIEIRDMSNVLIDTATDEVTLVLPPRAGTLTGTATVAAVAGVVTFAGLAVDAPEAWASDRPLTAFAAGAAPVESADFTITALYQLVFTTAPSASTVAGVAFAQQPVIEIRDMSNVLIDTATDEVTISLSAGDGTLTSTLEDVDGNPYEGPLTVAAVAGVATFAGLAIDVAGTDKKLAAVIDYAEAVETSAFTITAAHTLVFTTQPSASTAAGVAFAQQPVIDIRDGAGVLDTSATDEVTLILFSDGGTLAGTATVAAEAGVATFAGLSVDTASTGNILLATCAITAPVESDPFTIT